jgi:hypothetical protein
MLHPLPKRDVLRQRLDVLAPASGIEQVVLAPEKASESLTILAVADPVGREALVLDRARQGAAPASQGMGHGRRHKRDEL